VFTYHGQGGTGDGLAATAENLASQGLLVFSPSYRSTEPQYIEQDLECAYRYGLSIAEEYGGDLDQPITTLGHSFGAQMSVLGGLTEAVYGPGGTYDGCFDGAPRPDVIVAVTGCFYESPDGARYPFDTAGFSNSDADVVLIGGPDDEVCELWQSRDAAETLQAAGYSTALMEIDGGNHANVVFYEVVDGEWVVVLDDPVGHEVVELTIDAIDAAQ
jgi:acetyl esterase/lipase